jgi:dTDP-D-glucose 4,6-dehydratase
LTGWGHVSFQKGLCSMELFSVVLNRNFEIRRYKMGLEKLENRLRNEEENEIHKGLPLKYEETPQGRTETSWNDKWGKSSI